MPRAHSHDPQPVFDTAPLDIHAPEFEKIAAEHSFVPPRHPGSAGESRRVCNVYLNDPELQRLYPLGLLPLGQRHFFSWLTSHGRRDQRLRDEEIYGFLRTSAEEQTNGLILTYLLQPAWQEKFPRALTPAGWNDFRAWLASVYGQFLAPLPTDVPPALSAQEQEALDRSIMPPSAAGATFRGVNVISHFCNPSGIQQAALWTKTALERAGLGTSCRDVPVPRRIIPDDRDRWLGLEIFPITILTHAAAPYFLTAYERSGLFRRPHVYRIAYWAWELETVPDDWVQAAELVDEIWSPTQFVAKAMRARMPRPVFEMLPGVEAGPIEEMRRASFDIPEHHFVFLFMFDLHSQLHRKNPAAVVRAFQTAFRPNDAATLLIKTTGGDIHAADLAQLRQIAQGPNIVLFDQSVSRAQAYGLIAMADCFVSLHRSEGFGLGLAEAMLLGKPVIATGYSGNLDFMNRENSLLVDYQITQIEEDRPIYTRGHFWAEPSVEQAASYMREVYERPDEARARAARARPETEKLLSLDAAGQRMRKRLEEIVASWKGGSRPEQRG